MPDQDQDDSVIDPRHQKRIDLMQQLFARSFNQNQLSRESDGFEYDAIIDEIMENLAGLDEKIRSAAPERPLTEINKVDLAILRLIMFESEKKKTPKKVLINEAIELAKGFGTESSPRFVNGVLGKLLMNG